VVAVADAGKEPQQGELAKPDVIALAEQAEAEAAEAEALAAAARARARAIRLRREAQAQADAAEAVPEPEATAQEPAPSESAETKPAPRRLGMPDLRLALTATVVVAIVGLLAASGYLAWHHRNVVQERQRAGSYIATARQAVVNLTSLDFNKANEGVQRVLDIATGEFKDDFQKRAEDFASVVKDSKAVTEGSVAASAVESMNKDSAVVLVLANERVTNIAGAKDAPRTFRFRVSVVHDGDDLKVSKVEFVL
jgi:Mce-associated membrane protein